MDRKGVDVVCPFWHWYDERALKISCEGGKGIHIHILKCQSKAKWEFHRQRFCEGEYKECPYYKTIMEKYK